MQKHEFILKMYTKLSAEFDYMEFAESAARMIRERIDGQKKIVIFKNKSKYKGCADSPADLTVSEGNAKLMFPFSTHSNNFLTGAIIRDAEISQINELLLTKSVKMEILCEESQRENVSHNLISFGGYNIKG